MENHIQDFAYSYVRLDYSDDDGATWKLLRRQAITITDPSVKTYGPLSLSRQPLSGNLVLVVGQLNGFVYSMLVYISTDQGSSWRLQQTITGEADALTHDAVTTPTGIMLFSSGTLGGYTGPIKYWMPDGAVRFGAATRIDVASNHFDSTDLAALWDPCGRWRLYIREEDPIGKVWMFDSAMTESDDPIEVWSDRTAAHTTLAIGQYIQTATFADGSVYILGNSISTLGTPYDNSITATILGGPSSVTPHAGLAIEYLPPLDTATASGWTSTGAGTETITTSSSQIVRQVSTAANTRYWYFAMPGSVYTTHAIVTVASGGSTANDDVAIRFQNTDGNNTTSATLRMSTTQVRLYDDVAASYYGAAVSVTYPIEVRAIVNASAFSSEGRISVYVRTVGTAAWTVVKEDGVATHAAGTTSRVTFGHISSGTATSYWRSIGTGYDAADEALARGLDTSAPDPSIMLRGMPVCVEPTTIYASGPSSVKVKGVGGPTIPGDTWTITSTSSRGWAKIQPGGTSFSPRDMWVSDTISPGSTQYLVWDLEDADGAREETFGDVVGLGAVNTNAASITLERYSGGWTTLATLDLTEVLCTDWALDGHTLRPTQTTVGRYIDGMDPVGCIVKITDSTGDVIYRRVAYADHGQAGTGGKPWRLHLEPEILSGTWASVGTSSTGGASEVKIYWSSGVRVVAGSTTGTRYLRVGLTGNPVETTLRMGLLSVGRMMTLPYRPQDATEWALSASDVVNTSPGNIVSTRREAPPARRINLVYQEGKHYKQTYASSPSQVTPLAGLDSTAVSMLGVIPDLMSQIVHELGAYRNAILIPEAPSGVPYTIVGGAQPSRFIPGRFSGQVATTTVGGTRHGSQSMALGTDDNGYSTSGLPFTEDV
jgi:hypothetical protein